MKIKNITQKMFFFLIIGTLMGPSVYLGIKELQFFRLILIVSTVYILFKIQKERVYFDVLSKLLVSWFSFYLVWTLLSTLIASTQLDAYEIKTNSIINFFFMYILVLNTVYYLNHNVVLSLKTMHKSIVVMFFIMMIVALWEIFTQNHLEVATFFQAAPSYIQFQTATFFTNPNDFMAMYTMMFLFLVGYYKIINKHNNLLIYSFFTVALLFSFIDNSRLAMLVLLFSAFFIFFTKKNFVVAIFFILFMIIGGSIYIAANHSENLDYLISGLGFGGNSSNVRETLYQWGFLSIEQNYGLGLGVDNSANYYETINDSHLDGMVNPHNYFLEILINSGLITLVLYLATNVIILYYFLKQRLYFLAYLLLIYPVILISSSSSLFLWFHYVYLSGLIALFNYHMKGKNENSKYSF